MFRWIQEIKVDERVVSPIEIEIIEHAREGLPRQRTISLPGN